MNEPDRSELAESMSEVMRLMAATGLCHLRGGNCAVRVTDDGRDAVALTRTKSRKEALAPEDVVVATLDSDEPVEGASVNLALHRMVLRATDAGAILHGHPHHAVLLSYYRDSIVPVDENSVSYVGAEIPIVTQPGYRQWAAAEPELAEALTRVPAVVLRWHGAYTIGTDLGEAFSRMQAVDSAARFILDLARLESRLGEPIPPPFLLASEVTR